MAMPRAFRAGGGRAVAVPLQRQRRGYFPYHKADEAFDYAAEKAKWNEPSERAATVSELHAKISGALGECEDIMGTWREAKWFNRGVDVRTKQRIDEFLRRTYDEGLEPNLLDRLLLQYTLIRNGRFDNAFNGYFRNKEGVLVHDTEPRWDVVRRAIFTSVPAIDGLYHFAGYADAGYRNALGVMLCTSLAHAIPTAKSNKSPYAKVMFQHSAKSPDGQPVVRMLGSVGDDNAVDFLLLRPHSEQPGMHHLTLVVVASRNKHIRRSQVPTEERRAQMARRTEGVFGLQSGSVETDLLFTPPQLLDRHSLLTAHIKVGGLATDYAMWLPYYHFSASEDEDWAHQAKKEAEDEFYRL